MGTDDTIGYPEEGEAPIREVTLTPIYGSICHIVC